MTIGDVAAAIVANIVLIIGLLWGQLALPMVVDGQSYPLFDPALWSFWLPWFIVIAVLEIAFTVAVYRRGHWTYGYAIGNAILGAAFAIPAVYLLANHLLFNPAFVDALGAESESWLRPPRSSRAPSSSRSWSGTPSTASSRPAARRRPEATRDPDESRTGTSPPNTERRSECGYQ